MIVDDYLGKPWSSPDYDCWGFVRDVYRRELRVELPVFMCDANNVQEVARKFRRETQPLNDLAVKCELKDFAIVFFSKMKRICHVGIYYQGAYLHCDRGVGVCFEKDMRPYDVAYCCEYVG